MENDFAHRCVPIERSVECSTNEIGIDSRAGCPPDDQTGVDVHHHRQVQPPLSGPDVRYIAGPDLMRVLSHKRALETIWSVRSVRRRRVVTLNRRRTRPTRPALAIKRATRCRPQV